MAEVVCGVNHRVTNAFRAPTSFQGGGVGDDPFPTTWNYI